MHRRLALAAALAALAGGAAAQTAPTLIKVVSARDEVVVGVAGMDLDGAARKLLGEGQLGAWQYAVGRAADGSTEHKPLRRVVILRQDTLRLEAFDPRPLKVAPLPP